MTTLVFPIAITIAKATGTAVVGKIASKFTATLEALFINKAAPIIIYSLSRFGQTMFFSSAPIASSSSANRINNNNAATIKRLTAASSPVVALAFVSPIKAFINQSFENLFSTTGAAETKNDTAVIDNKSAHQDTPQLHQQDLATAHEINIILSEQVAKLATENRDLKIIMFGSSVFLGGLMVGSYLTRRMMMQNSNGNKNNYY